MDKKDKKCAIALGRLDLYLFRLKRDIRAGSLSLALANSAELSEIARRLCVHLENLLKERNAS